MFLKRKGEMGGANITYKCLSDMIFEGKDYGLEASVSLAFGGAISSRRQVDQAATVFLR